MFNSNSLKSQNFSLKLRGYNRLTNSSSESSDSEAESVFDNEIRASAVHTDVEQTFTLPDPGTNEDSDVVIVDLTPPERSNNRSASGTRPPPYRAKSTSLSSSGTAIQFPLANLPEVNQLPDVLQILLIPLLYPPANEPQQKPRRARSPV